MVINLSLNAMGSPYLKKLKLVQPWLELLFFADGYKPIAQRYGLALFEKIERKNESIAYYTFLVCIHIWSAPNFCPSTHGFVISNVVNVVQIAEYKMAVYGIFFGILLKQLPFAILVKE
uniref:Uncharacterized protein n=1 Tax=Haemonchus contortus TaxID=6289 RepID=A0A7I4XZX4_HAECO